MFQTRFKCFKHVANVQNTFITFKTRLLIVAPPCIPNALLIPEKHNIWQVSATVDLVCFVFFCFLFFLLFLFFVFFLRGGVVPQAIRL